MRRIILFSVAQLLLVASFAQKPDWTDFEKRKQLYPNDKYLVGFYSAPKKSDKPEEVQLQTLLEYAKTDIIENISVSITSASELNTQQTGKEFTQSFSQQSLMSAKAELAGLKTETWKDKKEFYALAYVSRSELISFYKGKLATMLANIDKSVAAAEQEKTDGDKEKALDMFYQSAKQVREAEQAAAILMGLMKQAPANNLVDLNARVNNGISSIVSRDSSTPDAAALTIAEMFKKQITAAAPKVKIASPTFQDSKMGSPFSAYFSKMLESKLGSRGFSIEQNAQNNSDYVLNCTYWKEADKLKLMLNMYAVKTGKITATAEVSVPQSWFAQNNISFMPENFEESYSRAKAFTKDEVVGGGLRVDLWTNKGDNSPVFFENDTMKIYMRVNHECYLRFVYYMADGSKVLLMNDYYIGSDKVNQVVEIPESFVCAEPFGNEMLAVNAQTEPFQKLNTRDQDGYTFINDNVTEVVAKTRGFKKATNQALNGEKRLNLTTLKKP